MSKLPSDLSTVTTVAVDLAKHVFQIHGCDASGKVIVAKALRRKDVLPFFASLGQGFTTTIRVIESTGQAFVRLISGNVNLNTISGPVGLTKIVGEAEQVGFTSLLMVIAIISVNLAIINILPFPALDGGRIVFVIIEAIIRRPLPKKFVEWVNGAGFVLLLLLMLVITVKDVIKLL